MACKHETFQLLSWREEASPLPWALDDLMSQILWGGGGGEGLVIPGNLVSGNSYISGS